MVIKALHLISVVSWFAGLLYLGRLFVYQRENQLHRTELSSEQKAVREALDVQYTVMARRLWRAITQPAMFATMVFGVWLSVEMQTWSAPWFHFKLLLIVLLLGYHFLCGRWRRELSLGTSTRDGRFFRIWNELGTLFLVAIVFLAVTKDPVKTLYGSVGFLAVAAAIVLAFRKTLMRPRRVSTEVRSG